MYFLALIGIMALGAIIIFWSDKKSVLGNACTAIIYGAAIIQMLSWAFKLLEHFK